VGVLGGTIVAVGPAEQVRREVRDAAGAEPATIDLHGHRVTPGFIDAHVHPMPAAFFEHHLDLDDCTSLDDLFDALADRAAVTAPDGVVLGLRLDDAKLAERRLPTRAELDRISSAPVVILRRDGHHAVGSTAALAAAGYDRASADPEGGRLGRDEHGELTGLCAESASSALLGIVPTPEWDELHDGLLRWCARLSSQGVTAIGAMCQTGTEGPAGAAGELEALAWSACIEELPLDVQTILITDDPDQVAQGRSTALHAPDQGRRVDAVKLFLDGTLGGHSACLHQPYADRPTTSGMLTLDPDDAYRRMEAAHLAGWSVCVHAIGDQATELTLELFGRVLARHPGPHRHRMEHASLLGDDSVRRLAELGIIAVVQPISIRSERQWLSSRLGDERVERVYRFRDLLDAGVVVAGSSDAPIEDSDVLAAMDASVDRGGVAPSQAVTWADALAMYTTGAAAATGSTWSGRLAPGSAADLVVLSSGAPDRWDGTEVLATVRRGRVVHRSDRIGDRLAALAGPATAPGSPGAVPPAPLRP
jgi:predicted amidohydrolase YtcJ